VTADNRRRAQPLTRGCRADSQEIPVVEVAVAPG
jgi:hypothetical protein